jgi:hypothetical protein
MAAKFWKTAGGAALPTGDLLLRRKFRRIKPVLKPKAIQKIGDQLAIAWSEGQKPTSRSRRCGEPVPAHLAAASPTFWAA